MTGVRVALALALTAAGTGAAAAQAEEHAFGPLPVAEAWLGGGSGFLSLPLEAPAAEEKNGWQLTASLGISSFWLRSPAVSEAIEARSERAPVTAAELDRIAPWPGPQGIYFADMELHRLTLDLRRLVGRRTEIGLRTAIVDAGGGILDPVIEGFHDLFGFRQSGRPQSLQNDYGLYFRRDGSSGIDSYGDRLRFVRFDEPGPGLGETIASLKWRLGVPDGRFPPRRLATGGLDGPGRGRPRRGQPERGARSAPWRHAVQVQLKLPTGSDVDFYGTGSVDAAIQYLVSRRLNRWTLYGNAGFARLGAHDLLTLAPQNVVTVAIAGERPIAPRSSMVFQLRHQQSPFRQLKLSILGVTATLIDIGWTRRLSPGRGGLDRAAFFSVSNNTAKYGAAVDISLQAGLRLRRAN